MDVTRRAVDHEAAGPENLVAKVEGVIEIEDAIHDIVRGIVDHGLSNLELVEVIQPIARSSHRDVWECTDTGSKFDVRIHVGIPLTKVEILSALDIIIDLVSLREFGNPEVTSEGNR